jgi:hypothetical protein
MGRITDGLVNYQQPVQTTDGVDTNEAQTTDKSAAKTNANPQAETTNRTTSDSTTKVAEHSMNGRSWNRNEDLLSLHQKMGKRRPKLQV